MGVLPLSLTPIAPHNPRNQQMPYELTVGKDKNEKQGYFEFDRE